MTNEAPNSKIAYLGPEGVGLGFELTGMTVIACKNSTDMITRLRELKDSALYGIIFLDEQLAKDQMETVSYLNTNPLPAILLLPNPANPQNLSAQSLKQLMIKAVGSDILK